MKNPFQTIFIAGLNSEKLMSTVNFIIHITGYCQQEVRYLVSLHRKTFMTKFGGHTQETLEKDLKLYNKHFSILKIMKKINVLKRKKYLFIQPPKAKLNPIFGLDRI